MALGDKKTVSYTEDWGEPNSPATLGPDGRLVYEQRPELSPVDVGARPRDNILDNHRFRVNQRGQSSYGPVSDTTIQTVDRWFMPLTGNTMIVADGVVTISAGTSTYGGHLRQRLHPDVAAQYSGRPVTISALDANGELAQKTGIFGSNMVAQFQDGAIFSLEHTGGFYTAILSTKEDGGDKGIRAAKVEIGNSQTLCYKDENGVWQLYDDYDYLSDLQECQRYLWAADFAGNGSISMGKEIGVIAGSGVQSAAFEVSMPVRLHSYAGLPSVLAENLTIMIDGSDWHRAISSVGVDSVAGCNVNLVAYLPYTLDKGTVCYLRGLPADNPTLIISKEL